jgi:hypothetical protein
MDWATKNLKIRKASCPENFPSPQGLLCVLKKLSQNGVFYTIYPNFKFVSIIIPFEIS